MYGLVMIMWPSPGRIFQACALSFLFPALLATSHPLDFAGDANTSFVESLAKGYRVLAAVSSAPNAKLSEAMQIDGIKGQR